MVKYCLEKYPMGSIKGQKSAGKAMDGKLMENIQIMARNIVRDMTFLVVVYSSTLEVGTGKSVFAQHLAEAYTEQIKLQHGIDVPFNENHIVFRPDKLIEVAPTLPKYSALVMDEWDEKNYFDQLSVALRQFFRKCRQLNQLMIIIIPDFFQLPKGYAISRSACAIDVRFSGEFERGHFSFYSFERKKTLYIKGKKTYNYRTVLPNFYGRFPDGYAVGEAAYRKAKHDDLVASEKVEDKKASEADIKALAFYNLYTKANDGKGLREGISIDKLAESFGVSKRTGHRWIKSVREGFPAEEQVPSEIVTGKIREPVKSVIDTQTNSSGDNVEDTQSILREMFN